MEAELIIGARQGDDEAYETLVRQHQEAVFRLAYLITGDADEAEDVAQETFIRAFRDLHRFDISRPLRPWLLRITRNTALNNRRSLKRYLTTIRRFLMETADSVSDAEAEYTRQWEARTLWQAVQQLNQSDQEVIYLRYFLELSVQETAAIIEVAPGTVKSRLSRALSRLRQVVQQEFPLLYEGRQL